MTAASRTTSAALLDETIELLLDTGNTLCAVLADSLPHEEVEALVRELAAELLDVHRAVTAEHEEVGS